MALIKEFNTAKGPVSYWVLGLLQIDNFNKTGYARLYGFFGKPHADMLNPVPIITLEVNLTPEIYNYYLSEEILMLENTSPLSQAYLMFKDFEIRNENGEVYNFTDALDDISEVI